MKNIFKSIMVVVVLTMMSVSAFAGTWAAAVPAGSVMVGPGQNLGAVATSHGFPYTSATSGSCVTGTERGYYDVEWTNIRLQRGTMYFFRQTCV